MGGKHNQEKTLGQLVYRCGAVIVNWMGWVRTPPMSVFCNYFFFLSFCCFCLLIWTQTQILTSWKHFFFSKQILNKTYSNSDFKLDLRFKIVQRLLIPFLFFTTTLRQLIQLSLDKLWALSEQNNNNKQQNNNKKLTRKKSTSSTCLRTSTSSR